VVVAGRSVPAGYKVGAVKTVEGVDSWLAGCSNELSADGGLMSVKSGPLVGWLSSAIVGGASAGMFESNSVGLDVKEIVSDVFSTLLFAKLPCSAVKFGSGWVISANGSLCGLITKLVAEFS
jgi:hypothetical protein